jgi:hypothetical protein
MWHRTSQMADNLGDDQQHLLDLLNAHGQQFLASFESTTRKPVVSSKRKRKAAAVSETAGSECDGNTDEEEWTGIGTVDTVSKDESRWYAM